MNINYREYLVENILPYWINNAIDTENGGIFTCIDSNDKVYDTDTFTVEGKELKNHKADVDTDAAYTPDTEVISDGYFHESEYRSAPYFDLRIDGITLLNEKY